VSTGIANAYPLPDYENFSFPTNLRQEP
jgi:hypothetical protein